MLNTPLVLLYIKKPERAFFSWNEATAISFGQISPLKKGVEGKG